MSFAPSHLLRFLFVSLIVLAAFWLRTHELARRPMHADEANQAVKLGQLLETGHYAFDPRDHHGPTLYYAAVPIAWLRGQHTLAELDETTIRLVPALFGTASIVLLFFLARSRELQRADLPRSRERERVEPAGSRERQRVDSPRSHERQRIDFLALAAAAFLALSPPAVYYSRYFIQETLLVAFTLATFLCARRWLETRRLPWAIAAGVSIGLMQATKATAPLFLAAAALACVFTRRRTKPVCHVIRDKAASPDEASLREAPIGRAVVVALAAAVFTAALLYSSFGTHFAGLRDALAAYAHAATRFGADAPPTGHEKPWWYYVHLFGWFRNGGLVWHQLAFSALAATGFVLAFLPGTAAAPGRSTLPRFIALYTAFILLAFSAFPYKTPWQAVHFVPGLALLAATTLASVSQLKTGRLLAVAFALITFATLFQQTQRVAFLRPSDQRNPYAYVHSAPDVLKYRDRAEAALARTPGQPIRVIAEEYWPLPWYLRGLPNVGYYTTPPENCDGALIIASGEHADAVRAKLTHTYRESFLGLRPGVICVLFTRERE